LDRGGYYFAEVLTAGVISKVLSMLLEHFISILVLVGTAISVNALSEILKPTVRATKENVQVDRIQQL